MKALNSINISSDLISKLPDSQVINEIAKELRGHNDNEVFLAVEELLRSDIQDYRRSGLIIAKKCLRGKDKILSAIDIGLDRKDVSEIKLWIRDLVPCIGNKTFLNFLDHVLDSDPENILMAWYELNHYFRGGAVDSVDMLDKLRIKLDEAAQNMKVNDRNYWESIKE